MSYNLKTEKLFLFSKDGFAYNSRTKDSVDPRRFFVLNILHLRKKL